MAVPDAELRDLLHSDRYPRSSTYDPRWVLENEMGPNALWLTEWLVAAMDLKPGTRVLDMGCGKGLSSVFLAREFGVQVWAVDLWISATENWRRIKEAGLEDRVFPVHAEARRLPFPAGFFDAAISIDSYHYYGTDDLYLRYFTSFLKPGVQIGVVVPGLLRDFDVGEDGMVHVPEHLVRRTPTGGRFWDPKECFSFHTLTWWRRHWAQTGLVRVEVADAQEDGWLDWLRFEEAKKAAGTSRNDDEIPALREDEGRYLGFLRMVGRLPSEADA